MDKANTTELKRTITSALENLDSRAQNLNGLVRLSEVVIEKLERDDRVKELCEEKCDTEKSPHLDLIGVIDKIANSMERDIESIGHNLDKAVNFIE